MQEGAGAQPGTLEEKLLPPRFCPVIMDITMDLESNRAQGTQVLDLACPYPDVVTMQFRVLLFHASSAHVFFANLFAAAVSSVPNEVDPSVDEDRIILHCRRHEASTS